MPYNNATGNCSYSFFENEISLAFYNNELKAKTGLPVFRV